MDSHEFYEIIDAAREGTSLSAPSCDPDALRDVLDEFDDAKVAAFAEEFARQHARLNDWSVWGAGYVIAGGMSDDGFHYFRSWLIGKGSEAVEQALSDADQLGPYLDDDDLEFENEELEYVAGELLDEREVDNPADDVIEGPATGDPFDEDTVELLFPALASRG